MRELNRVQVNEASNPFKPDRPMAKRDNWPGAPGAGSTPGSFGVFSSRMSRPVIAPRGNVSSPRAKAAASRPLENLGILGGEAAADQFLVVVRHFGVWSDDGGGETGSCASAVKIVHRVNAPRRQQVVQRFVEDENA